MVDLNAKYDVITGAKKTRKIQIRLSEALYQAIKEYLYIERKNGKFSEISRNMWENLITEKHGVQFIRNPLWEEQQKEAELQVHLDRLTKEFEELKRDDYISEPEPEPEPEVNWHPKYHSLVYIDEVGQNKCFACNRVLSNKGIHLHKCIKVVLSSLSKDGKKHLKNHK